MNRLCQQPLLLLLNVWQVLVDLAPERPGERARFSACVRVMRSHTAVPHAIVYHYLASFVAVQQS